MERTNKDTNIQNLKIRLRGTLISPNDRHYDRARRVWNGRIDKRPAFIVRCAGLMDVLMTVCFAQEQNLPVAIRSGGHSMVGYSVCDGGIVIDLSDMKSLWIDPSKRLAHAQAGLTLGEFISQTQRYSLATTTGTVAGTGLGGLTLGGGLGWLMGKYGLTIDNLLSADLVTADGRVLTASASEYPDLFWGLRGGGGNFGVVTSFEFQLHPVGPVLAGKIVYPLARAREVLHFYRQYTADAPDELTAYVSLKSTSAGLPIISINLCYSGPLEQGERWINPLRKLGSPLADFIHPRPYFQTISIGAGAPDGRHYDEHALSLQWLSDDVIDIITDYASARTSPFSEVLIQHVHGTASRISPTATAFALRDVPYVMNIVAAWHAHEVDEAERHLMWTQSFQKALQPLAASGVYINFLGDEGEERVRDSYKANYERLVALKNTYDPSNFFQLNQNIKPKARESATGVLR
jgi:hypothetical protein